MSHIPVNHHLRPLYRGLATLAGIFVLLFGVVGLVQSAGGAPFGTQDAVQVFGLRTNLAFSVLSIIAGLILAGAAMLGRNLDHVVNIWAGVGFMVVGMLMLGLLHTDANFLAFSMPDVIVSFVIGIVVFAAGLYGKTGTAEEQAAEEAWAHGTH